MSVVYKADPVRGAEWAALFAAKAPELPFHCWPQTGPAEDVRFLVAWLPPNDLLRHFPNLEILFSVGAGVDQFDLADLPDCISLVRMTEAGIAASMGEYVTLATLALHRDLPTYLAQQRRQEWREKRLVPARRRRVGIMGMGRLGRTAIERLRPFGFPLAGWSRSGAVIEDVESYAGAAELPAFLARTDILVCLLPLTQETHGILCKTLFECLPRGAALVNAGRGGHLVTGDLLEALSSGQLSAAMLDVSDPEPLPPRHPLWDHPGVILTPHVASMTVPESAVDLVLDTIRRHRAGLPLPGLVDRRRGY